VSYEFCKYLLNYTFKSVKVFIFFANQYINTYKGILYFILLLLKLKILNLFDIILLFDESNNILYIIFSNYTNAHNINIK